MRVGQTSFVVFVSKFVASMLGFVATLYFARELGAEILGFYAVTITVVSWLRLSGQIGFGGAIRKRISEGEDQSRFAAAGATIILGLGLLLSLLALLANSQVEAYVGRPVAPFVSALVFLGLAMAYLNSILTGYRLVHIVGVLEPVRIGFRSLFQIGLVIAGLGLGGMLYGYIGGLIVAIAVALIYSPLELDLPSREHFRSLFEYAKFSWLGNLKYRSYNDVDILVLGIFVPSNLIGIYSVAWSITKFLTVFDTAVSSTVFPEISRAESEQNVDLVETLISDSLRYAGLILIPGFVGSLLLSGRILDIYGGEFVQGAHVMSILIFAALVYGYQKQFVNALNAVNRPELGFRVNGIFIVANLTLNVALVYLYGWTGAAVATLLSALLSLFFAIYYLRSEVDFELPGREIGRQLVAALLMAGAVYGGIIIERTFRIVGHNFVEVILLVIVGAAVYFTVLLAISPTFKETLSNNSPIELPFLKN